MSAKYERLRAVAQDVYGEKRFCTVLALAVAADVSFGKAHAAMARAGRKKGCGAHMTVMQKAAAELGYALVPRKGFVGKTMATVMPNLTADDNAIVEVTSHVAAYKDGAVHDWSVGRRKRLLAIWDVKALPHNS